MNALDNLRTLDRIATLMNCQPENNDDFVEAVRLLVKERDAARAEALHLRQALNERKEAMTDDDLKRLQELCDRATPGPWVAERDASSHRGKVHERSPGGAELIATVYCGAFEGHGFRNAELIAAMRTHLPALIAEVRRLRAEVPVPDDLVCAHGAHWGGISVGACGSCDGLALEAAAGPTVKA